MHIFRLIIVSFVCLALSSPAFASSAPKKKKDTDHEISEMVEEEEAEFAYYDFSPMFLPVIGEDGVTQHVSMLISLEVEHGIEEGVEPYATRLLDAYFKDLYNILGSGYAFSEGSVNTDMVQKRLKIITEYILNGELEFHDLVLQVVQQHALH